jgi:adenine-specific DNA-methyltransferase
MDARGEIYWSPTGNPRRKIYLDESEGVPVQDLWLDYRDAHNQNIHVSGYPTEKNPHLLSRIVGASSDEGDLVLDCFSGSGTTLSVAAHLGRHWVGIDNSVEAVRTTLRRFGKGLEPMGDFVSKLEASEREEATEPNLLLPGLEHAEKPLPKAIARHRLVKDFELFAQEPYAGSLDEALDQWREWIGEPAVMHFAEGSAPYRTAKRTKQPKRARRRRL